MRKNILYEHYLDLIIEKKQNSTSQNPDYKRKIGKELTKLRNLKYANKFYDVRPYILEEIEKYKCLHKKFETEINKKLKEESK